MDFFLKAHANIPPTVFSGLELAYFGVHVLGELQDGVHSCPGIWMLL